jgi:hypothetical protein
VRIKEEGRKKEDTRVEMGGVKGEELGRGLV